MERDKFPTQSDPSSFDWWARHVVITLLILTLVFGSVSLIGLYADGTYYLWNILQFHSFELSEPARAFSEISTQIPVVLALKLGVRNIAVLTKVYSFGLIGVPLGLWLASLLVLRRNRVFWPFAVCFAATFGLGGFFAAGGYNVAYGLVVLNAALLVRGDFSRRYAAVLLISAACTPFSYESLLFLGPMLAAMTALRIRQRVRTTPRSYFTIGVLVGALLFYTAAALISLYSILFPIVSRADLSGAQDLAWPLHFDAGQLVGSGLFSALFVIAWCLPRFQWQFVATLIAGAVAIWLMQPSVWNPVWLEYPSRIDLGILMFVFVGVIAIEQIQRNGVKSSARISQAQSPLWVASLLFVVALLVPFTLHMWQFSQWLSLFEHTVHGSHGFLTDVKGHSTVSAVIRINTSPYVWSWTSPFLSAIVSPAPHHAIVVMKGQSVPAFWVYGDGVGFNNLPSQWAHVYRLNGSLFGF